MKRLLILAALVASLPAFAAKPKPTPAPDTSVTQVMKDRYFLTEQCYKYLEGYSEEENRLIRNATGTVIRDEALRYVTNDDSITKDFEAHFAAEHIAFNPALLDAHKKLEGKRNVRKLYIDNSYSEAKVTEALEQWKRIAFDKAKSKEMQAGGRNFVFCRTASLAAGVGKLADYAKDYVAYVDSIVTKARIGYFEISADRGQYAKTVGTGNRFSEPKSWDGSRFFIVSATFKNLDTESRMPFEGSLFITYNGKEYEFDSVEPIHSEGYNLWFHKINPLITMKTKIVYRIPDEIEGPVFWRPGRNAADTKLWLGYIPAEKS